jgi:hypothetical protein
MIWKPLTEPKLDLDLQWIKMEFCRRRDCVEDQPRVSEIKSRYGDSAKVRLEEKLYISCTEYSRFSYSTVVQRLVTTKYSLTVSISVDLLNRQVGMCEEASRLMLGIFRTTWVSLLRLLVNHKEGIGLAGIFGLFAVPSVRGHIEATESENPNSGQVEPVAAGSTYRITSRERQRGSLLFWADFGVQNPQNPKATKRGHAQASQTNRSYRCRVSNHEEDMSSMDRKVFQ